MLYITVPGWSSSGPGHWQTRLEETYEGFLRVLQDDWDTVERDRWVARLDQAVQSAEEEVFLIGHSCGSVTIAQWAATHHDRRVVGALLVAPADVESDSAPQAIRAQAPLPAVGLGMRTHVVISDNDPLLSLDRGLALAEQWGSSVEVIAKARHFATADGFGQWDYATTLIERHSATVLAHKKGFETHAQ
jgi:serine hydrolase